MEDALFRDASGRSRSPSPRRTSRRGNVVADRRDTFIAAPVFPSVVRPASDIRRKVNSFHGEPTDRARIVADTDEKPWPSE
jgi:hypothetical protein